MSLDKLIELNEKKTELLKEYKASLKYESCTHDVLEQPDRKGYYWLFDTSTCLMVKEGSKICINKFLQSRNIDKSKVYNYSAIEIKQKEDSNV